MHWNRYASSDHHNLTHKQLETHGFLQSIVATDVVVLKHQAISIHSADKFFIALTILAQKYHSKGYKKMKVYFRKKKNYPVV